eukprot:sb/3475565/
MIDLLDTEWVYNPEELGSEGLDRIDEEEGTGTKEPHQAWRVLGVTSISWVNALWEWFTREVCIWLDIRACRKVPIKMLAKEVETKLRFQKVDRNNSPVRSGTKRDLATSCCREGQDAETVRGRRE